MNYFSTMRELSELRRRRQSRVLAACARPRHAARMATQKTQIRQRLGAEIARLRARQGMPTQRDLAKAVPISIRTVNALENGDKVAASTLRKVEAALGLRPGVFDEFLGGKIENLGPAEPAPAYRDVQADLAPLEEVLTATTVELAKLASMYAWYEGRRRGDGVSRQEDEDKFLLWAVELRRRERHIVPPGETNRDVS